MCALSAPLHKSFTTSSKEIFVSTISKQVKCNNFKREQERILKKLKKEKLKKIGKQN